MTDKQKSNLLEIIKCLLLEIAVVAAVLLGKFVAPEHLRNVVCIVLSVIAFIPMIIYLFKLRKNTDEKISELEKMKINNSTEN